jgi:transposase
MSVIDSTEDISDWNEMEAILSSDWHEISIVNQIKLRSAPAMRVSFIFDCDFGSRTVSIERLDHPKFWDFVGQTSQRIGIGGNFRFYSIQMKLAVAQVLFRKDFWATLRTYFIIDCIVIQTNSYGLKEQDLSRFKAHIVSALQTFACSERSSSLRNRNSLKGVLVSETILFTLYTIFRIQSREIPIDVAKSADCW